MSAARSRLTAWDGRPVPRAAPVPDGHAHHAESARCRWLPIVAAHVGWPLLGTAPDIIRGSHSPLRFSPPPFGYTPRCSAPCWLLLHSRCSSPMSRPELSDRAKRSASSSRPSNAVVPGLAKPGHGISPLSSSSTSTSLVAARSDRSPTPLTPQQAPCHRAPPPPLLQPPQPLLWPLTSVSSLSDMEPLLEPLFMYFDHGIFHFLPLLTCDLMQISFLVKNEQGSYMNT
jgi:hypothetical protein